MEEVRAELASAGKAERRYPVELFDEQGHVCANCDILVHIHTREPRPAVPVLPLANRTPA